MANDVPYEVPEKLWEAIQHMRSMWDEMTLVIQALRIENQVFGSAKGAADVEATRMDLSGTVLDSYKVASGDNIHLSQPALVAEHVSAPVQTSPGEKVPAPKTVRIGETKPMATFETKRYLSGELIRLRLAKGAKPGARAYLKITNLRDMTLDVLTTIPDDYPWGEGFPEVFDSSEVDQFNSTKIELTQPIDDKAGKQVLLYYCAPPWLGLLHPVPRVTFHTG